MDKPHVYYNEVASVRPNTSVKDAVTVAPNQIQFEEHTYTSLQRGNQQ